MSIELSYSVQILSPEMLQPSSTLMQVYSTVDVYEVERMKFEGWRLMSVRPVMGDILCYELER